MIHGPYVPVNRGLSGTTEKPTLERQNTMALRFTLNINVEQAAFWNESDGSHNPLPEVSRILANVSRLMADGRESGLIHDINGVNVGTFDCDVSEETQFS